MKMKIAVLNFSLKITNSFIEMRNRDKISQKPIKQKFYFHLSRTTGKNFKANEKAHRMLLCNKVQLKMPHKPSFKKEISIRKKVCSFSNCFAQQSRPDCGIRGDTLLLLPNDGFDYITFINWF